MTIPSLCLSKPGTSWCVRLWPSPQLTLRKRKKTWGTRRHPGTPGEEEKLESMLRKKKWVKTFGYQINLLIIRQKNPKQNRGSTLKNIKKNGKFKHLVCVGDEGIWRVLDWVKIHTEYTACHHVNAVGSKEAGMHTLYSAVAHSRPSTVCSTQLQNQPTSSFS